MVPRTADPPALPISDRFFARGANVQLARSLCERPWIAGAERVLLEASNGRNAAERPGDERFISE